MSEVEHCVLEQLTEVATVTNSSGDTEELFILHPPKPAGVSKEENEFPDKSRENDLIQDPDYSPSGKSVSPIKSNKLKGKPPTKQFMQSKMTAPLPVIPKSDVLAPNIASVMKIGPTETRGRPNKIHPMHTKNYIGYPCEECGKVFTLKGNLKVHMRVHTDEKPYTCSFEGCGKTFRGRDMLNKHEMAHNGIKPWTCGVCQKGFSSKNSMIEHEARHTNSKPYKCKDCGQEFRQYSCLSRHYMVHKEEYNHQCSVCSKKFKSKVYLQSHMKVHSGVAMFKCSVCSKRFKHQSDLNRHSNIHTGKKPYVCSLCGSRFSDVSAKNRHEREHNGIKPFECRLCGEKYKRQGQLKTHMIKRHTANGELSAADTALLFADQSAQSQQLAVIPAVEQQVGIAPTSPVRYKIEKRMITHHVAVPKVNGKAVNVDPVALLEHIKDQLDPSQMPQTVDGQPIQVSCKVIQQDNTQQVMELQYLSTIHVPCRQEPSENTEPVSLNRTDITVADVIIGDEMKPTNTVATDGSDVSNTSEVIQAIVKPEDESGNVNTLPVIETVVSGSSAEENFVTFHMDEAHNQTIQIECNSNPVAIGNGGDQIGQSVDEAAEDIFNSSLTETYVKEPDFGNQNYYNWLSVLADACKTLTLPLSPNVFGKISNVNKKLTDMMANPKGVLANKNNFVISMSISKELSSIIDKHLNFVLTALDNNESEN